jgi:hypothetical protein
MPTGPLLKVTKSKLQLKREKWQGKLVYIGELVKERAFV